MKELEGTSTLIESKENWRNFYRKSGIICKHFRTPLLWSLCLVNSFSTASSRLKSHLQSWKHTSRERPPWITLHTVPSDFCLQTRVSYFCSLLPSEIMSIFIRLSVLYLMPPTGMDGLWPGNLLSGSLLYLQHLAQDLAFSCSQNCLLNKQMDRWIYTDGISKILISFHPLLVFLMSSVHSPQDPGVISKYYDVTLSPEPPSLLIKAIQAPGRLLQVELSVFLLMLLTYRPWEGSQVNQGLLPSTQS